VAGDTDGGTSVVEQQDGKSRPDDEQADEDSHPSSEKTKNNKPYDYNSHIENEE